jgi:hypothetical protein
MSAVAMSNDGPHFGPVWTIFVAADFQSHQVAPLLADELVLNRAESLPRKISLGR